MNLKKDTIFNLLKILVPFLLFSVFYVFVFIERKNRPEFVNVQVNFDIIEKVILDFKNQTGYVPESLSILTKEKGADLWDGPFISKGNLVDPWQTQYKIIFTNKQPIIISFGPNKKLDTTSTDIEKKQNGGDDIVRFLSDQGIIGRVSGLDIKRLGSKGGCQVLTLSILHSSVFLVNYQ